MIKIEYWNGYDILDIHYGENYRNKFWLNVDVIKPEYIIDREQTEDALGDKHNLWLKWEKQYSFDLFCLEHVADMLSMITLHDNVWVTFENGYSGKVRDFIMESTWSNIPSVAKVICKFTVKAYTINGSSAANCS
jgi:hypothetical protein